MKKREITNIMKEEHRKIDNYVDDFLEKNKKEFFNIFKENIKKHFDVEQESIFAFVEKFIGKELEEIYVLERQHKEILRKIKEIEKNLPKKQLNLIDEMAKLIAGHIKYEEKIFYPKIDEMFDQKQKDILSLSCLV